jgi:DNA-binding response OmpR family regulator/anti-sigma regulatory factor (Ser/Thr protein kinase)
VKPTVLIVDDSLTVRMDLNDALESAGFTTTLCTTVAEARHALSSAAFALIILDVILPDGDGIALLAEIRETATASGTFVMLLSSEAEVQERIRGLKTGADEYVGKPYDRSYVVARATELVHRKELRIKSPTVLIIDDSPTYRAALTEVLESSGFVVVAAGTGEEGLRVAVDTRPAVIVVDGVLPGIDGLTVISRIRADAVLRRTPCILLTASEEHGGELRALDAGADVYVRKNEDMGVILARVTAALRSSAAPAAGDLTASLLGPKKILIVDDSLTYLHEVAGYLRQEGYDVILAHSGEEALELLLIQPVDCILLDVVMPGLSGYETSRRIKNSSLWRDIPLIMHTSHDDMQAMVESLDAGADDYIAKSPDFEVLRARVRAQLRRKQFEDENRSIHARLAQKEQEVTMANAAKELAETRAAFVEELERKNRENEELLAAYERSERVSTRFQEAALPEALPTIAGFSFDAFYQPGPSDSVLGGDWYDALRLADGRIILSIGDVGGSGLGAAIIMATIRQVIRGVAYIHPDPVMILDAAGKALRAEHPDTYVTAFVGLIDPVAMTLTFASAGHPAPLLRHPDGSLEEILYDGILLGLPALPRRVAEQVTLSAGSLLIFYTDGLIEATQDVIAGQRKLFDAVRDPRITSNKHIARSIHDCVTPNGAHDDIAIMTVEVLPSPFQVNGKALGPCASRWVFDAADAIAAQCARAEFAAQLRAHGARDEEAYNAEIVFGELTGNVLRHAQGNIEALVDWTNRSPVLHIRDYGSGFSHAPRLPRDILDESGRGLYIITALTEDFNVTREAERGSHARAVLSLSRYQLSEKCG